MAADSMSQARASGNSCLMACCSAREVMNWSPVAMSPVWMMGLLRARAAATSCSPA